MSSVESATGPDLYDAPHLARNAANFAPLSPLGFLSRSAQVYPDKLAIVHGAARVTYGRFYERCRQFADALRRRGIQRGDAVAVMAPNLPALLEAHYGVPMAGAVLNALNYRLDARSIAFILAHGQAKLLIADREFSPIVDEALAALPEPIPLVEIDDDVGAASLGGTEVEDTLYRHPLIMEAAVVARPDPVWGESPCAFVTLKPDAGPASPDDIIAWCRANLAHFKVPRRIVFGPLPKTSTGKIQKYKLRERAKDIAS